MVTFTNAFLLGKCYLCGKCTDCCSCNKCPCCGRKTCGYTTVPYIYQTITCGGGTAQGYGYPEGTILCNQQDNGAANG